jgi:hypothetical protein
MFVVTSSMKGVRKNPTYSIADGLARALQLHRLGHCTFERL